MRSVGVLVLALVPVGCFIPKDLDVEDLTIDLPSSSELPETLSITDATATVDATATADETTVASLTTTETATSTTTGETDTETDTEGSSSVCDPQPEDDVESTVIIDGNELPPITDLQVSCIVTWVGGFGSALHLGLACEDGEHTLDVPNIGPIDVDTGDIVELSVFVDAPWWSNVYVALRRNGAIVLAAIEAESLPTGERFTPPDDFFAPLEIIELDDVCAVEPPEDEECGGFICTDPCYRERRMALAVFDGGDVEVVYDAGTGQLGELALAVDEAVERVDVTCADTASQWLSFVAVRGN